MSESEFPKSVLISGGSGDGKSTSLMNLREQEGVLYLNCEGGKPIPFKNKFKRVTVDDPYEIFSILDQVNADTSGRYHTIVIDTISFMMNRFESVHVIGSANTMAAWGLYGQFFPTLMYDYVAKSNCFVIMLGHLDSETDDNGNTTSVVPVKGALKKNGLEAYFTTVINARKLALKDIAKDAEEGKLLTISDRERDLGYKHVFQTRTVRSTVGDRVRSPLGLFADNEAFIDNDVQTVIDQLTEYYSD